MGNLKFVLDLPPSINQTYAVSNRTGKSKFYKRRIVQNWEYTAGYQIKHQWKGKRITFLGKVKIEINLFHQRGRDIDASIKVILDLLQHMRIYQNDSQAVSLLVTKSKDLKNPRCEIIIEELPQSPCLPAGRP